MGREDGGESGWEEWGDRMLERAVGMNGESGWEEWGERMVERAVGRNGETGC